MGEGNEEPSLGEREKEEGEPGLGQQGKEAEGLTPWEQHSVVISIPRYDYRAPSSFLERSHSGFLITCPIKREKSATKEALSILEQYVGCMSSNAFKRLEPCGRNSAAKKRKICSSVENVEDAEGDSNILEVFVKTGDVTQEASLSFSETDEKVKSSLNLSLVKLTRSGLLLFIFPSKSSHHAIDILSNIFLSLEIGDLKPPLWCHRIFPIQETCVLIEKDLQIIVSKLFQEYLGNEKDKLEKPIKFAVGYNRRGIDQAEMKQKTTVEGSKGPNLLDRDKCFQVVAAAVKDVAENSVVDLKSPEVVVLVELLPLSGIPHAPLVAGVSVLPHKLIVTKPRLVIKPLISDPKVAGRRGRVGEAAFSVLTASSSLPSKTA